MFVSADRSVSCTAGDAVTKLIKSSILSLLTFWWIVGDQLTFPAKRKILESQRE